MFWPASFKRGHCHTANPETSRRVLVDGVTFWGVYTEWARSPCTPVRSVVNLYLYCVGSGKWFKTSHTHALGGVRDFCHVTYSPPPPPANSPLPSTSRAVKSEVHRGFSPTLYETFRCNFKRKHTSTLGDHQNIFESPLHKSTVLISISSNKTTATNENKDLMYGRSTAKLLRLGVMFDLSMSRQMRSADEAQGFWTSY
jgi:hypothetical protein